jgi:dCMP deaminase
MAESKPEHSLNFAAAEEALERQPEEFRVPVHVDGWDEYFLWLAKSASIKSKDPKCPVGAVIASEDHIVLSTGFNGMARGVFDDDRTLDDAEEKIKVICHAENNAILNAARIGARLEGATIYVTKFPCLQCCNAIVQAGIKRLYTHDDEFWGDDPADKEHTRKPLILKQGRVEVIAPFHKTFAPAVPIRGEKRRKKAVAKAVGEQKPGPEKMAPAAKPIAKVG